MTNRRRAKTVTSRELRLGPLLAKLFQLSFILIVFLSPIFSSQKGLFAAANSKDKVKPYAVIAGTVWGPDNRAVYGVTVKIRRPTDKPTKARWEVYSDHMGEFAQRVPAGDADYIVWADLKGLKTADRKPLRLVQQVTVHIYNDEREDTGLHLSY
jgi:hypothetical protein